MIESNESRQHYLFAVLLFIAGLLIILIFLTVRSQADDTTSSAAVSNATPTIDSVTIATASEGADVDALTLTAGSTKTVYVHGAFHDDNGCAEVTAAAQGVKSILYSPLTNQACNTDGADCYQNSGGVTCTYGGCTGGTDTDGTFECSYALQYYSDPGDWTAYVTASDGTATSSAHSTNTSTIADLAGVNLTGTVNYGAIALGAASTIDANETVAMANQGNVTSDFRFSGTAMTCQVGTISVGQQHYATGISGITSSTAFADLYPLTGSASTVTHDLVKSTDGGASATSSYWQVTLPSNGIAGTCSGTLTIAAIKST